MAVLGQQHGIGAGADGRGDQHGQVPSGGDPVEPPAKIVAAGRGGQVESLLIGRNRGSDLGEGAVVPDHEAVTAVDEELAEEESLAGGSALGDQLSGRLVWSSNRSGNHHARRRITKRTPARIAKKTGTRSSPQPNPDCSHTPKMSGAMK